MNRPAIYTGLAAAAIVTALELGWYYVANLARIDEPSRGLLKETLFWLGIATVGATAVIVSLRNRNRWWIATIIATAVTVTISSLLYTLIRYLWGANLRTNSAMLGESRTMEWAGAVFGYLLLITGFVCLAIITGGTARLLASLLKRSDENSHLTI